MGKMCAKCGSKPACVKSMHAVRKTLCFNCGMAPHIEKIANASIARRKAKKLKSFEFDHGNNDKGKQ